jgi:hypothetical protein
MAAARVEIGSLNVEAHIPASPMAANRREQDLGPWHNDWLPAGRIHLDDRTEQPPQSTSVVMHSDPADGRQGHAAWMAFPNPDAGGWAVGMLVAEPTALATVPLRLSFGKPTCRPLGLPALA